MPQTCPGEREMDFARPTRYVEGKLQKDALNQQVNLLVEATKLKALGNLKAES